MKAAADSGVRRVLVVDDEEEVGKVYARGLARAGYDTQFVTSGEAALDLLQEGSFDVLLTDIHMPRLRGDELQRIARERDPHLAVLLITAAPDVTCAIECLKEGAYDYILKPATLADVAARVDNAWKRRQTLLDKERLERENRDYQENLERRVTEQADRIRALFQHALEALIQTLEAKDESTRNHSARVADLAAALAARLRPHDSQAIARLRVAALFHDLGKIGIPESVLNKSGKLNNEEMAQVRRHPELGEAILRPLFADPEMLSIVRHHHEQWNGEGYPDGLMAETISWGARIVAVADSYDAMTSARAYRPGMAPAHALRILREGAEDQWDPEVVGALLALSEEGHWAVTKPCGGRPRPGEIPALSIAAEIDGRPGASPPRVPQTPSDRSRRPVIFVQGDLDTESLERIGTKAAAFLGHGENDFVVDLRQAGFVDQSGVQTLYLLHLRVQGTGGCLSLRDVPDHVLHAFREAGIADALHCEQSPIRLPRRPSRFSV